MGEAVTLPAAMSASFAASASASLVFSSRRMADADLAACFLLPSSVPGLCW